MGFLGSLFGTEDKFQASNPYEAQSGDLHDLYQRQNDIYNAQSSLGGVLRNWLAGQGPNPAQLQYQGNVQNNIANAQGMIASQRGLNPALAARMGVNAAANANNQASLGSALAQAQQQIATAGMLGSLYHSQMQGNQGQQGILTGAFNKQQGINSDIAAQNAKNNTNLVGGLINAGGGFGAAMVAAHGAVVPGKAKVSGDSPANDTVPAMLSPGEVVVPRSMAHDPEKAKEFIDHLLKSKNKKKGDYKDVLAARRKRKAA